MIAEHPHRLARRGAQGRQAEPLGELADDPSGVSPGRMIRADRPSAQAEALTSKASDFHS